MMYISFRPFLHMVEFITPCSSMEMALISTTLIGKQPNPWNLLQLKEVMIRPNLLLFKIT